MLLSPQNRLAVQRDLEKTRDVHDTIDVILVTTVACSVCGHDTFTNSSRIIPCSTCNDTGWIATKVRHTIKGRVELLELPELVPFKGIPPGVESGDALIFVSIRDYDLLNTCYKSEYGYIIAKGRNFKPMAVDQEGLGRVDEYRVIAKKHKPTFTV